jgi:hypothetical protein
MHLSVIAFVGFVAALGANQVIFPYEAIHLTDDDIGNFSAIAFADNTTVSPNLDQAKCKAFPGGKDWPADYEWDRLNTSLGGALLKPIPAASSCYIGLYSGTKKCNFLLNDAKNTRFYSDDPLTVLTQWPEGNTCLATKHPSGDCTQGGFPIYVVNATTAKHVQIAANFARNKNIRLVIK